MAFDRYWGLGALLACVLIIFSSFTFLFAFIGSCLGRSIRSKTQQRRDLLLQIAAKDEIRHNEAEGKARSSASSADEDWEKISTADVANKELEHSASDRGFESVIGFFHPFCNAGGGGERVLFAAVLATQARYPKALCAIYTGDHDASKDQILANVRNRFNIDLKPARICFVYLGTREYVLPSKWPHFTLLGQSIGSLILGWDAFNLLVPDVFIDTMGYAFILALSKWLFPKMPTAAYVHYPTISTDMLHSLQSDSGSGHGLNAGRGQGAAGKAKQFYWERFAQLYSWIGGHIDIVMTNSSWTQNHIAALWTKQRERRRKTHPISVVYPPCAVEELHDKIVVSAATEKERTRNIVYIAQFRPEKMHHVIIEAFHSFLQAGEEDESHPSQTEPKTKLILVGSARDDADEKRVYKLRLQAQDIKDRVEFVVNKPWSAVLDHLRSSSVGVNGMWNEHFGIGVVEYQAAGLISVVNDSGGPKADIVVDIDGAPTGFYATTPEDFARGFSQALSLSPAQSYAMRERARKSSLRFSEKVFHDAWTKHLEELMTLLRR